MRIEIAQRYKPFCHRSGTQVILPRSTWSLKAYPARLEIEDRSEPTPKQLAVLDLDVQGPIDDFTVMQDLEKSHVKISGKAANGHFRYHLDALGKHGAMLMMEKAPAAGICIGEKLLKSGENLVIGQAEEKISKSNFERLSLGSHKAQDWELMRRRQDFRDIFPLWYSLGQQMPEQFPSTFPLLNECREAIASNHPEKILSHFKRLFLAGFEEMLVPRLSDTSYQGIVQSVAPIGSPLQILTEGFHLIRSLFLQQKAEGLYLLPALPPEFHCGRLVNMECEMGQLTMEWTKKALRRVVLKASKPQTAAFFFSQGETRCRLRHSFADRGVPYYSGSPLDFMPGQQYWLDQFQR